MTIHPQTASLIRAITPSAAHLIEQDPMDTPEGQTEYLLAGIARDIDEAFVRYRDCPRSREAIKRNHLRLTLSLDILQRLSDKLEGKA